MSILKFIKRKEKGGMSEEELYEDEEIQEACKRVISKRYEEIVAFLEKYGVLPKDYSPPRLIIRREKEIKRGAYERIKRALLVPISTLGLALSCYITDYFIYPKVIFKFSNVYKYPTPFTLASGLFLTASICSLPSVLTYAFLEWYSTKWSGKYHRNEREIEVKMEKALDYVLVHELCHELVGSSEIKASACETVVDNLLHSEEYLNGASNEEELKERVRGIKAWCNLQATYLYKSVGTSICKVFGGILLRSPFSRKFRYNLGELYGYLLLLEMLENNELKSENLGGIVRKIKKQREIDIYNEVKKLKRTRREFMSNDEKSYFVYQK